MNFILITFVVVFALIGFTHGNPYLADESDKDDETAFISFNCSVVGKFPFPNDCTKYIHCGPELNATVKLCPTCDPSDELNCPDSRLYFDFRRQDCVLASEAKCPSKPTTATTTTTTTTTTVKPPVECELNCTQTGYCKCYDTCVPDASSSTGGSLLRQWCDTTGGDILWWNPDAITSAIHGGSCDYWGNLSPALQETYIRDDNCNTPEIPCYWKEDPACANKYWYLPEGSTNPWTQIVHVQCPRDSASGQWLYWDQSVLTCTVGCPASNNNGCNNIC